MGETRWKDIDIRRKGLGQLLWELWIEHNVLVFSAAGIMNHDHVRGQMNPLCN